MLAIAKSFAKGLKGTIKKELKEGKKNLQNMDRSSLTNSFHSLSQNTLTHDDHSTETNSSHQSLASSIDHIISELAQVRIKYSNKNELFSETLNMGKSMDDSELNFGQGQKKVFVYLPLRWYSVKGHDVYHRIKVTKGHRTLKKYSTKASDFEKLVSTSSGKTFYLKKKGTSKKPVRKTTKKKSKSASKGKSKSASKGRSKSASRSRGVKFGCGSAGCSRFGIPLSKTYELYSPFNANTVPKKAAFGNYDTITTSSTYVPPPKPKAKFGNLIDSLTDSFDINHGGTHKFGLSNTNMFRGPTLDSLTPVSGAKTAAAASKFGELLDLNDPNRKEISGKTRSGAKYGCSTPRFGLPYGARRY